MLLAVLALLASLFDGASGEWLQKISLTANGDAIPFVDAWEESLVVPTTSDAKGATFCEFLFFFLFRLPLAIAIVDVGAR